MVDPRSLHRGGTRVMSLLMIAIGLALVVVTIVAGGGAIARGVVVGALFVLAGAGRLYLQERRR
jgi:hypothetical protein